ncbi:MAG: ABC transporter ATP-binding protein [Alphaproteobacteria bacterium]|nr:ABC transporter ATP-binding protein [Alphaproteobacteria bacterium]
MAPSDPVPVLQARDLSRRARRRVLVEGVDLDLHPGEILGLIGPNGGGKSTLLHLLAGLLRPTTGTVTVDGVPADRLARTAAGKVALITPEPGLYPLLTGRENLRWFGELHGLSRAEVDTRIDALAPALHLGDALDQRTAQLSSGTRQKLSLCRALAMRPRVLLLDEPTANLDPVSARAILAQVRARADDTGLAVVLCTHDLVAAEALCERVLLLATRPVHLERFDGPRHLPAVGALFAPYQQALADRERA